MTTALQIRDKNEMALAPGEAVVGNQQYLSFMLAGEEYGLDILRVQEIRGWETPTLLPNAPAQIKGVINLRGVIVPVLDLRAVLGMTMTEYSAATVVIILHFLHVERERILGIVVDAVSEVFSVEPGHIKPAPECGTQLDPRFVAGLAKVNDKVVILLQSERLLDDSVLS